MRERRLSHACLRPAFGNNALGGLPVAGAAVMQTRRVALYGMNAGCSTGSDSETYQGKT